MFIFSNLATTLDGKIAPQNRALFPLGTPADRKHMLVLRKRADAVFVGASTLRSHPLAMLSGTSGKQPWNVILSSRLDGMSPDWKFFTEPRTKKIIFVSHDAPETRIRKFSRVAEIHRLEKITPRNPVAKQIVQSLSKLGVKKLLVEGGGSVMWDFIRSDLLDEINLTLTPRILGGTEAPTLVDGDGFTPEQVTNYKLKSCRRLKDELYLVYSKKR